MGFIRDQLDRHSRFYLAVVAGTAAWLATGVLAPALRLAVTGDTFFCAYLIFMAVLAFQMTPGDLRKLATAEDEGIGIIILITIMAIAFSLTSIFALLNQGAKPDGLRLALSVASAPLGWFMLHTVAAFHYAHRYHRGSRSGGQMRGLSFPDTPEPGIWDFVYYSFVIGMTAQVSDVQVVSTPMRQLTLGHSIVSFFYNTVLIALAVNVVVVLA